MGSATKRKYTLPKMHTTISDQFPLRRSQYQNINWMKQNYGGSTRDQRSIVFHFSEKVHLLLATTS